MPSCLLGFAETSEATLCHLQAPTNTVQVTWQACTNTHEVKGRDDQNAAGGKVAVGSFHANEDQHKIPWQGSF